MIIRARERKEEKSICSSRLSRSCFTLSHELMSGVWPVRRSRSFLTESIVALVSICEIAYSLSLSRDNPQIPTNPLSGNQQPPLL